MSSFYLAPASILRNAARKAATPASGVRAFSRAAPVMVVKHWKAPPRPSVEEQADAESKSLSRAFSRNAALQAVNHWKAPPRPTVSQDDMPINPGPNPDPKNIGVNAVVNQRPESMDKHVTTIFAEFSLFGKTAVVTGGNRGLGLEMALAFVEAGAHVFVIDRAEVPSEEFQKVAKHCQLLDRQIEFITADVTDADQMNETMHYIAEVSTTKSLDVVVANAGIMQTYPAIDYPVDEFRKMLDVNTIGCFVTAQAGARVMKERKIAQGSIILTASMSGTVVNRDQQWVAYNTSKAAVLQMGRNLAAEWGPHDIRVNTLSPGYIRTNLVADQLDSDPEMLSRWSDANPLGRIGRPHELRGVVVWLASSASSFCNGADIIVSGGHTIW